MPITKNLAQQFERQGIRCTEDDAFPQLWCSFCTAYLNERNTTSVHQKNDTKEREESQQHEGQRTHSQSHASDSVASSSSVHRITVPPTKDAILEHCATRLHLHLYEHHVQEDLRQWCPVELHGYRMLLDHHCVYPARMFGDGRLLMDFTIVGGMLLGQDVCGGVKLWPQHRYAATELVLPSSRSGVREVWVPSPKSAEVDGNGTPLSLKRLPKEGRYVQLIHESSEIPGEVAWAYNDDVHTDVRTPRAFRKDEAYMLQFVPRYFDEIHGMRSRRVMDGTLATVLDATNASIIGEARLREKRRRYSITHNIAKDTDNSTLGKKRTRSGASEET